MILPWVIPTLAPRHIFHPPRRHRIFPRRNSCHGKEVGADEKGDYTERPQGAQEQTVVEVDIGPETPSRQNEAKVEVEHVEELQDTIVKCRIGHVCNVRKLPTPRTHKNGRGNINTGRFRTPSSGSRVQLVRANGLIRHDGRSSEAPGRVHRPTQPARFARGKYPDVVTTIQENERYSSPLTQPRL